MYDVIIAGGGPAGATAGYLLSQKGIRTLIIDRSKFPRDKPCGGAITPRVLTLFPYTKNLMEIGTKRANCYFKTPAKTIEVERSEPFIYFVRRIKFDADLLNLAKDANCEVLEGIRVTDLEELPDKVRVKCNNGEIYEGKILLGADGVSSTVREKSSLKKFWNEKTLGIAFRSEVEIGQDILDEYYSVSRLSHICFSFGDAEHHGYGWIFTKPHHVNIGYGETVADGSHSRSIKERYDKFVVYSQRQRLLPPVEMPKLIKSWLLQTGGPIKCYSSKRILLLGDAAGFANAISGEGILFGMWSGRFAFESIEPYISGIAPIESVCSKYTNLCEKNFARDLRGYAFLGRYLDAVMPLMFQLAPFDPKLRELLIATISGELPLKTLRKRLIWRIFLGILKGNVFKKVNS
jgi:geranylgeranyl reductase family protein